MNRQDTACCGRNREAVEAYKEFLQYALPRHAKQEEHAKQRLKELEGK